MGWFGWAAISVKLRASFPLTANGKFSVVCAGAARNKNSEDGFSF